MNKFKKFLAAILILPITILIGPLFFLWHPFRYYKNIEYWRNHKSFGILWWCHLWVFCDGDKSAQRM